jgi:transcriptional regulator with XRE-family HTH domain
MSFGENLRETLDFLYMAQNELAAKTGISPKTIANYVKKDASAPSACKAVAIAQALGVTVEYLVTGKKGKDEADGLTARNRDIIALASKLTPGNYEVVVSLAKTLLKKQQLQLPPAQV